MNMRSAQTYAPYEESLGGFWDKLGSGIKKAGGWAVETYGSAQQATGRAEAAQQIAAHQAAAMAAAQQTTQPSGLGKYLPWIAIGGGGLVLFLVLSKRK